MKSILKDTRGYSIEDLSPIVLTLIIIGVLFGAGLYVLSEFSDKVLTTLEVSVPNETTTTVVNETGVSLQASIAKDSVCTVLSVINYTTNTVIASGNYTYDSTACTITFAALDGDWNNSLWNVSYSFTATNATAASAGIGNASGGIGDLAGWIPIIVIVLAAAIMIGIVIRYFTGKAVE